MTTPFDAMDDEHEHEPIEGEFEEIGPELEGTSIERLHQETIDERVHLSALSEHAHLQRIILPEGATALEAIKELSKDIPENEFALPTYFYRSDMLPFELGTLTQEDADACIVELDYSEGYPTFNHGHIFWNQLPHEPITEFLLFQRYLDQAEELGLRQLQLLAMQNNTSLEKLHRYYHLYYWQARARAHDLFQVAADRKKRELRQRNLEDRHYLMAEDLIRQLKPSLEDPDLFNNLTGKEKIEVLRLLINIQRVSNGLPQNGNAGAVPMNPDSVLDGRAIMEEIAKNQQRSDAGLGLGGGLAELLKDPNFAFEAQRVVLRVRQHQDPNAAKDVTIRPVADS